MMMPAGCSVQQPAPPPMISRAGDGDAEGPAGKIRLRDVMTMRAAARLLGVWPHGRRILFVATARACFRVDDGYRSAPRQATLASLAVASRRADARPMSFN